MYCEYTNSYLLFSISFNMKCVLQLLLLILSSRLIMVLFIRQSFCFHDKKVKRILIKYCSLLQICSMLQFSSIPLHTEHSVIICYRIYRMRLRMLWSGTTTFTGKVLNVVYKTFFESSL